MNTHPTPRTLYLNGNRPLRIFKDGPALRVRTPGAADRLFPLRGLFQVIACGPVEWATSALLACADATIPVVFLRANGTVRGRVLGLPDHDPVLDINQAMDLLLARPGGVEQLHEWFAAKSQQARLRLLQSVPWHAPSTNSGLVRQIIMRRARLHARASDLRRYDRQLYGLLLAHITTQLQKTRIDLAHACLAINKVCLERCFANVIIWTLQEPKLRYIKHLHKRARVYPGSKVGLNWHNAVELFEVNSQTVTDRFESLLKAWHLFILEYNYDYAN